VESIAEAPLNDYRYAIFRRATPDVELSFEEPITWTGTARMPQMSIAIAIRHADGKRLANPVPMDRYRSFRG
jgi:hypothetical protein